jgi:predicted RNA binding protein YcfA (HicA-like mRNA interferase family)
LATFGDLERYLELDGWQPVQNRARGRARGGDHDRYEKPQPSGRPLRTKVSRHPNDEIGPDLFKRILREQLQVDEATFWRVIRGTEVPAANAAPPSLPGKPGWLVLLLIAKVGLSQDEIERMSTDEAEQAWEEYQVRPA